MDSRISVEQEREIKLVFRCQGDFPDRGSFEHSLKRSLARCTANIQITRLSTGRIVSEYWDTDTGTLAAAGLSLRVRTDRMSQRTTVKAVPEGEGFSGEMLRHREEVHIPGSPVEGASPDPAMFRNTPVGSRLLTAIGGMPLQRIFVTDVKRDVYEISIPGDTRLFLMLDEGWIRSGTRALPVREVELEWLAGDESSLYRIAKNLCNTFRVVLGTEGKSSRGLRLADRPVPCLPAESLPSARPDRSPGETAVAAFRILLARIAAGHARFCAQPEDPDCLHDLRVDLRRLSSLIALLKPCLEVKRHRALRRAVRRLVRPTASLREADMLADAWQRYRHSSLEVTPAPDRIGKRMVQHRRECAKQAIHNLNRVRWSRAMLTLSIWASAADSLEKMVLTEEDVKARLGFFWEDLLRSGRQAGSGCSADYHRLRVAVKRYRYLSAFFPGYHDISLSQSDGDREYLHTLQDALGDWHDAQVNLDQACILLSGLRGASGFFTWLAQECAQRLETCKRLLEKFLADERLRPL